MNVAEVFQPLLAPARYKGAYGGRGGAKTHFFGALSVVRACQQPGYRQICIREVQKTLANSSYQIIADKIRELGVGHLFDVGRDHIGTPGGGQFLFQGMQSHNADSIKSLEGFDTAWVEEAQTISERSLSLLRPTIRKPGSEIWFSWNPRRKTDAVDKFLRTLKPDNAIVVRSNWSDNPWWNDVLDAERLNDLRLYPERYEHTWEGAYATAFEGAYFASGLAQAKAQGRIGKVAADPLLPIRAFFDLGGSGANADAMAIWIVQWVGQEIRVLDYIEGIGQVLAYYITELRKRGYDETLVIRLPHDGINNNNITGKRYEEHFREAGFTNVESVPNQGRGAASLRIEAVRRLLNRCWFNETTTEAGREALGYYHEKKDDTRDVGLGPDHDWSSHAADAFGLMAICYEEPSRAAGFARAIEYESIGLP